MEDLLKLLIEPLVGDIKKIKIEKIESENRSINFKVFVPKDEIAKVIGKEGKMIKAITNLLKIRAFKEKAYVNLEITEI